jgi:hypothetical protein
LAGSELRANHILGCQPWANVDGDASDIRRNSKGLDKFYPCGPKCTHMGKEVDTFVTISEHGSIDNEILTLVMKHLDRSLQLDRLEAIPFLLLDGHGSRFGLDFLRYINNRETRWTVCIGVPYGTHLWQMGDSSEQNGAFKQALIKQKQKIIYEKSKLHLPGKVEKQDIIGLVHHLWNASFAKVESNKKAIRNRGWNPLNYKLLDHPELTRKKKNDAVMDAYINCNLHGVEAIEPSKLNFTNGVSQTMLDNLLDEMERQRARNTALMESAEERREESMNHFQTSTRMSAGIAFNAQSLNLSTGSVLDRVEGIHQMREEREAAQVERRAREDDTEKRNFEAVTSFMVESNKTIQDLNVQQLKALVKWFKRPGDSKMPSKSKSSYKDMNSPKEGFKWSTREKKIMKRQSGMATKKMLSLMLKVMVLLLPWKFAMSLPPLLKFLMSLLPLPKLPLLLLLQMLMSLLPLLKLLMSPSPLLKLLMSPPPLLKWLVTEPLPKYDDEMMII